MIKQIHDELKTALADIDVIIIGNNFNFRIHLLFPNKQITKKDTNISVICYRDKEQWFLDSDLFSRIIMWTGLESITGRKLIVGNIRFPPQQINNMFQLLCHGNLEDENITPIIRELTAGDLPAEEELGSQRKIAESKKLLAF